MSELLSCPFCGGIDTQILERGKVWNGMGYGPPTSVVVLHHCEPVHGQPLSRGIERIGRDRESAIAAWNRRATNGEPT